MQTGIYLDFEEGQIKRIEAGESIDVGGWPVGSVIGFVTNDNPNIYLGYGVWVALGTLTIGGVTVYYSQRTD